MNRLPFTFSAQPMYGANTRQPLVDVQFQGTQVQLTTPKAREIAGILWEAAESSMTDAFVHTWDGPEEAKQSLLRWFARCREADVRPGAPFAAAAPAADPDQFFATTVYGPIPQVRIEGAGATAVVDAPTALAMGVGLFGAAVDAEADAALIVMLRRQSTPRREMGLAVAEFRAARRAVRETARAREEEEEG